MIATLFITVFIEGVVVVAYCIWGRKPLLSLLITSVAANIMTQSILWAVVNIYFRDYLAALLICEIFIWLFESLLIFFTHKDRLTLRSAALLSLCMNFLSFGTGWLLPV